ATEASVRSLGSVVLPRLQELHLGFDDGVGETLPELIWGERALDPLLEGGATPALQCFYLWLAPQERPHPFGARVRSSPLGQQLQTFELVEWEEPDEVDIYSL